MRPSSRAPGVRGGRVAALLTCGAAAACVACGASGSAAPPDDGGSGLPDSTAGTDGGADANAGQDAGPGADASADAADASSPPDTCTTTDAGAGCYAIKCTGKAQTLTANRDRLVADLAKRKCTDRCALWAALNLAERYIFLMDTAYLGDTSSRLYPPGAGNVETALDHAVALYSINGPMAGQGVDGSGRGGNDYNRIYLGFDALATCVMRSFAPANPGKDAAYNQWQTSDDLAGPHAPFNQREMIFWYRAIYDPQSEGPQFHHWHADADFSQSGIDARLGVCGVGERSLTELTIAFDTYHNSDPLGDYAGRGGTGWQIVDQHVGISADWGYMPTGCPSSAPVNTDPYGGGTFAGMGPSAGDGGACAQKPIGDGGC